MVVTSDVLPLFGIGGVVIFGAGDADKLASVGEGDARVGVADGELVGDIVGEGTGIVGVGLGVGLRVGEIEGSVNWLPSAKTVND